MSELLRNVGLSCLSFAGGVLLLLGGAVLDRRRAGRIWSGKRLLLFFPAYLRGTTGLFAVFLTGIVLLIWRDPDVGPGGSAVPAALASACAACWLYLGRQVQLDAEGVRLWPRFGRSRFLRWTEIERVRCGGDDVTFLDARGARIHVSNRMQGFRGLDGWCQAHLPARVFERDFAPATRAGLFTRDPPLW